VKQLNFFLAATATTLLAGSVVADVHAVRQRGTGTKAAVPESSLPGKRRPKRAAVSSIDRQQADLVDLSDRIWPTPRLHCARHAPPLARRLRRTAGFKVASAASRACPLRSSQPTAQVAP